MSAPTTALLTLEIELYADPVTGVLRTARQPAEPFVGWVDLASTLGRALVVARRDADQEDVAI